MNMSKFIQPCEVKSVSLFTLPLNLVILSTVLKCRYYLLFENKEGSNK